MTTRLKIVLALAVLLILGLSCVSAAAESFASRESYHVASGLLFLGLVLLGGLTYAVILPVDGASVPSPPAASSSLSTESTIVSVSNTAQTQRPKAAARIYAPPGAHLYRLANFFYSRKTMAHVFEPMLADMREEYFDALAKGRAWKARWIRLMYYRDLVRVVGLKGLVDVAKEVVGLWKLFQ